MYGRSQLKYFLFAEWPAREARRVKAEVTFLAALLPLMFFLLYLNPSSYAQVLAGTLTGSVVDPSDAAISEANVTVVDLDTGRPYSIATGPAGYFAITNLPNGFYRVIVEAHGFVQETFEHVQVSMAQTAKVNAKMKLVGVGTEISVNAEQAVVQTESAEIKNSVDRKQIMGLPLPTRNPLDLVRTMAGITTPTSSPVADAYVRGLRGNSTNITQDGINVADYAIKTSSFVALTVPTVDTVGEFNVSVGGIGVDSGFGAAQVSMRTQRGTNDFHGSVFWFQRTDALNANTWFNNASGVSRPFQLQNRIGGSTGGPLEIPKLHKDRSRSWLFLMYEAFREPLSRERTRTVLTPSARLGMFTYTPPAGGAPQTVNLLSLGTLGTSVATPTVNHAVMDFYNNLVPADGLTDAGCSGGDGVNIRCLRFNLASRNIADRYTLRFDHELTRNHSVEFVFNQSNLDSTPDLATGLEPNFPKSNGGGQTSTRQMFTWAFHSVLGANKTNEIRAGYQRAPIEAKLFEQYKDTGGFQLNVANGFTDPTITSTVFPQGRNTPVRQLLDNFTWMKGKHTLLLGGEYRRVEGDFYVYNVVVPRITLGSNSANPNGIVASKFPGGISSGDLARAGNVFNAVTGLLGSIQQGFNFTSPASGFVPGVPRKIDPLQHNFSFYLQENFKVRLNMTLQAGMRWEYQGVYDVRNRLVLLPKDGEAGLWGPAGINNLFNPLSAPKSTDTLLDFAGGRNGKPVYNADINNLAPFLGFAWDPNGKGKTSVRGSFSTQYTQDGLALYQLASVGNAGLFSVLTNSSPTGVFSLSSNPVPAVPQAAFPVSQKANFAASNLQNLWYFNQNLATPYVLSWNLSVQRELWKRFTIEARYAGNHAVKQLRSWNINELDVQNNGLQTEFLNAQKNLTIGVSRFDNQGLPGQVPLPVFDKLFSGIAAASGYSNSAFITQLNQNQIGALFDNIRRSPVYATNREASFPLNYFVANPYANQALMLDNAGWSTYNGLEVETTRRFSNGLFFQANYTYSKVLTDIRFLASQNENQNYLSLRNRRLDKSRASFDVPHSFSANFVYPLPARIGKKLRPGVDSVAGKIIGGWSIQGITRWASGAPFSIVSPRQAIGSLEPETVMLRNMTVRQLQQQIGVYRTPSGVFWLNPDSGLVTVSGATSRATLCTSGQTTPCFDHPGVNQLGNTPYFGFNGPRFFNQDLSVIKRIPIPRISEAFNVEIRTEFFNAFNTANFATLTGTNQSGNLDSSSFGKMTSTVDTVRSGGVTSRVIQWALRINW